MIVRLLLKQHVGAPAIPLVERHQTVRRGQLIAKSQGLGAQIHSSITGQVIDIQPEYIEIDGQPEEDFIPLEGTDRLALVEAAGIVGAGGAGFPSHVKLQTKLPGGCVIANAAECEPVLSHNITLLNNSPEMVLAGLCHVRQMVEADKAYLAIKAKHQTVIEKLTPLQSEYDFEIFVLPDLYPSGDERVIVREILGVELAPGQLPLTAGAVIFNVETLKHIHQAIDLRKPFIDKDLTIGGRVRGAKHGRVLLDQPLGRNIYELIEETGGFQEPYGEVLLGGPFTGQSGDGESVITKTSGAILVAMPYPKEASKLGLLVCECGASEERMRRIAQGMGADIVAVEYCKRMSDVSGRMRCELPGVCPGQTEKVLMMKKKGIQAILAGSCGD